MLSDDESMSRPIEPIDSSMDEKIQPSRDSPVHPTDVLCGRGKTSFNHAGNKRFRKAITSALDQYMRADNRFEKALVVQSIVDSIQETGGRFLKKDAATKKWYELSDQQSKEKVGHAIRDAVNSFESRKTKIKAPPDRLKVESRGSHLKPPPGAVAYAQHPFASELHQPLPSRGDDYIDRTPARPDSYDAPLRIDRPPDRSDTQDQFLARINAVLGPLPPDAEDPMEPYFDGPDGRRRTS